ncbi:LOB domain-containing protein 27-like [Macadamia integrifolia]|uniref:LOB domain-containing protein 27-like n=1 Tax=Macadamia integrifolia TaxID=60698 RepID=UPI001C4F4084|nr:LOB domain-containing protein 27-like [Macadamia integrifolia]
MTVKGGTSQACAACKYQRRKCAADCALAPYFPPDKPKMFQNAHRLFGVSNILKILKQLSPHQKNDAMGSIIYQAYIREKFPVHGCYGFICQLRFQIEQLQQELLAVQTQLALYRQHHQNQFSPTNNSSPSSQLQLGMATSPSPNNALPLFHYDQTFNGFPTIGNNGVNNVNAYNTAVYLDSKDNIVNPSLWIQNQNPSQSPLLISQALPIQQEEAPRDYDEIPPFFDTIDDRQSYIDSKEAYDSSSSEDSLKDTTQSIEQVQENELKSAAAACFNFTTAVN